MITISINQPIFRPLSRSISNIGGVKRYPKGAILHFDAGLDPYTEQTGGPNTFNHAVLSPQYQRNADGSYSNVGAKPAVDVFDGEKWLRTCGAVTNLLQSGSEDLTTAFWTQREQIDVSLVDGFYKLYVNVDMTQSQAFYTTKSSVVADNVTASISCKKGVGVFQFAIYDVSSTSTKININVDTSSGAISYVVGSSGASIYAIDESTWGLALTSAWASGNTLRFYCGFWATRSSAGDTLYLRNPQLTATSYPVPYVPPGVTQPASNATTTNGSWFALPDGSELWKALDGQADGVELVPNGVYKLTNAEVVRDTITLTGASNEVGFSGMSNNIGTIVGQRYVAHISGVASVLTANETVTIRGVTNIGVIKSNEAFNFQHQFTATANYNTINIYGNGVGNIVITNVSVQRIQPQPLTLATRARMGLGSGDFIGAYPKILSCATGSELQFYYVSSGAVTGASRASDGTRSVVAGTTWPRNSIIRRVTQVSADGTQFRVGCMIEGTHTAIQWSVWVAYDGSFNPSTLYRLMLSVNNAYPMWFNKITAWKEQVSDDRILAAMS